MDAKNSKGLQIALQPKTLILPTALVYEGERILKSSLRVNTADNDLNALKSMGVIPEVFVNNYLTDNDQWFVRTNCPSSMCWFDREAVEFSNRYAPEHLVLGMVEARKWVGKVRCAGSVFVGEWSPEVAGDYASGTNHTLPTSRFARNSSGVSLDSFVNKVTFQELTREGLKDLAPALETLAEVESLEGHARAVRYRLNREEGVGG